MSLRTRLTLAGGGAVFVSIAIASAVIYVEVRSKLHDQIDFSLIQSAEAISVKWHSNAPLAYGRGPSGLYQVVTNLGATAGGGLSVTGAPVKSGAEPSASSTTRACADAPKGILCHDDSVARGLSRPYFRDVRFGGAEMRLYTTPLPSSTDGVVRTARPLTEANATISRVRWLLLGLTVGGALVAALLGRLAANTVLRPVRALAGTVRAVSATRDLNRRIPVSGRDELASLAADFNTMLTALDESQHAQQQLIADASHELRTPLTAHRANIELLARPDLPVDRRQRVLAAAVRSIEELSALVADLIGAARDGRSLDAREPLALEELVATAVERAQLRAPGLRFESTLEPCRLVGARARLERAVDNVLDNAIKWSPSGGGIDIRLDGEELTVRDRGPGIPETDLPHVFDRFYRAAAARALPGSGLGLAIVKQTIDDHAGTVALANAAGGGVLVTIRFGSENGGSKELESK